MVFRVTQSLSFDNAKTQVQQSYARLYASQLLVSRGKRISKPSDDPNQIAQLLSFKQSSEELERFSSNASQARAYADSASASAQEASDIIQRVREAIVQGLNGSLGQTDRNTIATQIDGYLQELLGLANSRVGERFVFGGTATSSSPFELETDPSGQQSIVYHGNEDRIVTEVGPNLSIEMNVPGSEIFMRLARGATTFSGTTGVAAGTGANNGVGTDNLVIRHGVTTLGGASGLALGASSASGDTIIGSHTIDIDDVAGTLSLDGGPPVSYTGTETNLRVDGADGEVVFLDVSGISAGFQGQITATASGDMSTDGGASWTPISFGTNDQVIDAHSGAILNLDTTNVRIAGREKVTYGGTLDLFQSLIAIRDSLREVGDDGDEIADLDRIRGYLDEFDSAHDTLLEGLSELGSIGARLETAETRVEDLNVRLKELISKAEDVDISEAVIALQQNETAYQSALLVTSRVNELSLLNYF